MTTGPAANPVRNPTATTELRRDLEIACSRAGFSSVNAKLLHFYANAVWLLPEHPAVARVTYTAVAQRTARVNVAVCQWLVDQCGFPATALLSPDVIDVNAHIAVTFWRYYPQPTTGDAPGSADLGRLLRTLHALPRPPLDLPAWRPLTSLELVLRDTDHAVAVNESDRRWLLDRIEQIRQDLAALDWPLGYGLIHGDAWAGNLLWDTRSTPPDVVLGDWDSTCWGPREVDLIPSWHAAIRYGRGLDWSLAFAADYGHDLAGWPGFPVLFAMRDLVQLVALLRRVPDQSGLAQALRQRLGDIKAGDTTTVWQAF